MHEFADSLEKPCFICEYAHAMGNAVGNLKEYWDIIETSKSLIGGAIWDWVDQAIYEPLELKQGIKRIHTGYDFPGPHQGNFCSNGLITPDRAITPKLTQTKAVYQYIGFELFSYNQKQIVLTIKNKYDFLSLNEFVLRYQTVADGVVVGEEVVELGNITPNNVISKGFKLHPTEPGQEVLVNFFVETKNDYVWAKAGHVVAAEQYIIAEAPTMAEFVDESEEVLKISEAKGVMKVSGKNLTAKFDKRTGSLISLDIKGTNVIVPGQGFEYTNYRYIENDKTELIGDDGRPINGQAESAPEKSNNAMAETGLCKIIPSEGNSIAVKTFRDGQLCAVQIVYTFYPSGVVDMDVKMHPKTMNLRRASLMTGLNPAFDTVDYYAYGPWENHNDRKDNCMIGRYTDTVTGFEEGYVKPQSMGNREGVRELTFKNAKGEKIHFDVDGEVSFSSLWYTDEDLMKANHSWELQKRPYIVLHLNADYRGVGNGSCGWLTGTIPAYCIPQADRSFAVRITKE